MTSVRSKRSSKTPNRFSSDNSRIETMNMSGETIIDFTAKTTSTTHNLVPSTKAIKLKPVIREPLKVKLPKLRRPCQQSPTSTDDCGKIKNSLEDIKIHKIKLPPLGSKKLTKKTSDEEGDESVKKIKLQVESKKKKNNNIKKEEHVKNVSAHESPIKTPQPRLVDSLTHNQSPIKNTSTKTSRPISPRNFLSPHDTEASSQLNNSVSSKSFEDDKSFSADTSLNSEDGGAESSCEMEIIVAKNESPAGSGIRCPCGVDDDLGVMVECESCSTWQHGHCINVGTEEEAYEGYICAYCSMPQEKYLDSLRQLTVNDKYLSRFIALAELKRHYTSPANATQIDSQEAAKVSELFSPDDLFVSLQDLQRVLNSLKVKWKILTSQAYKHELRIWQNANWSEEKKTNPQDMNLYFIDRCKANLKLNISNMVEKMEERLQLINYALFLISSILSREGTYDRFNSLRVSCHAIAESVQDYKERLKCLTN